MKFDFGKFKARAERFLGPKARERRAAQVVFMNRRVRRALRKAGPRAERVGPRMAAGYPGPEVRNTRGRLMGLSAKETPQARRMRRARGVGMARPRVADSLRTR